MRNEKVYKEQQQDARKLEQVYRDWKELGRSLTLLETQKHPTSISQEEEAKEEEEKVEGCGASVQRPRRHHHHHPAGRK